MMWGRTDNGPTPTQTTAGSWTSSNTATTTWYIPRDVKRMLEDIERNAAKRASREALQLHILRMAHTLVKPPPAARKARHGFQQMARLPCYRGTRTR